MNFYDRNQIEKALEQQYAFIKLTVSDHVMTLTLDRAEKKNALHPQMINEIAFALQYAKQTNDIWVVILQAEGNIFCAGADLQAFMGKSDPFESSIPLPNEEILLGELFNKVHKPIITKVEGDVYAGGFFFLAGATYVLANDHIKLGLPEVKRGLYPFQVMAALLDIMPKRKVIDWCIRGYNLSVQKAEEYGLVTHITNPGTINAVVQALVNDIKNNSPTAIRLGLEALDVIQSSDNKHKYLVEMLKKTIATKDGQEGLKAFKEKRKPVWTGE